MNDSCAFQGHNILFVNELSEHIAGSLRESDQTKCQDKNCFGQAEIVSSQTNIYIDIEAKL